MIFEIALSDFLDLCDEYALCFHLHLKSQGLTKHIDFKYVGINKDSKLLSISNLNDDDDEKRNLKNELTKELKKQAEASYKKNFEKKPSLLTYSIQVADLGHM